MDTCWMICTTCLSTQIIKENISSFSGIVTEAGPKPSSTSRRDKEWNSVLPHRGGEERHWLGEDALCFKYHEFKGCLRSSKLRLLFTGYGPKNLRDLCISLICTICFTGSCIFQRNKGTTWGGCWKAQNNNRYTINHILHNYSFAVSIHNIYMKSTLKIL